MTIKADIPKPIKNNQSRAGLGESQKEIILLCDVSSIFYRSWHSLSKKFEATDISGKPSVGCFGFFTTFFKVINEVNPTRFVFAIDVKGGTTVRKEKNENYKANRKPKPKEFYEDLSNLIDNYIPKLKMCPLGLAGYEADDIIGGACKYIANNPELFPNYHIYILSGDADLEQCIKYTEHISFIKTQPAWKIVHREEILEKWGCSDPSQITLLKAIIGDGSDNISGVPGYKIKRALKVLNDTSFLEQHSELIANNIDIIQLRDDLEVYPRTIDLSRNNLEKIFLELNSKSLLNRLRKETLIK